MMGIFLAFVKKEFLHILRDRRTLFILIGMPIALVLIFGYTITNEFKDASYVVIDKSSTAMSKELIDHLSSSGHFKLVASLRNTKELEEAFKAGTAKMGVIIPPRFDVDFHKDKITKIQLIADASEPNYAATLTNYARRMIMDFQLEKSNMVAPPYQINIEMRMLYNPKLIGAYNFIPGVMAMILMLISAMMTSLTITREKETGTLDLLLVSPLSIMVIILGKVTPYILLSFLNALIVIAMGFFVFDVPIQGSLALLLILSLLYVIVALCLGVLISTKASNQQMAMIMSLFILMLPTILLSGFMFPIASMPKILQYISIINPAKYFVKIQQAVMLKGAGWDAVSTPTFVLLFMMVVLIAAARKNFKVVYK
jgi:ABC-2 type transport system permease protein